MNIENSLNLLTEELLDEAIKLKKARKVINSLKKLLGPVVYDIEAVGSVARLHPEVGDVDMVAVPHGDIQQWLKDHKIKITSGQEKAIFFKYKGVPINLWLTPKESFGATVLHFSAGKGIIQLKQKAISKGMTLNRYGLFKDGKMIAGKDYKDILRHLESSTKFSHIKYIDDAVKNVDKKNIKKFRNEGQFPRITDEYYRFRQIDPNDFDKETFRIVKDKNGNARIVGKLKDGKWKTQSIMIGKKNVPEEQMQEYLKNFLAEKRVKI